MAPAGLSGYQVGHGPSTPPTRSRSLSGIDSVTSRIAQLDAALQRLASPDAVGRDGAGFATALRSAGLLTGAAAGPASAATSGSAIVARAVQLLPANSPLAALYGGSSATDPSAVVTSTFGRSAPVTGGATSLVTSSVSGVTPKTFPMIGGAPGPSGSSGAAAATGLSSPVGSSGPVGSSSAAPAVDSYLPTQVTETDSARWQDCAFSAAAMLIDDMSHGGITVTHQALRAASGVASGGVKLADVQRAVSRTLGIHLAASPAEQPMTWTRLLDRLESGSGAVLVGSYSNLPAEFSRWDPKFAAKGAAKSGHALFVGAYDRATDRIWVQDPLAPATFKGEWVPTAALRDFSWTNGDGEVSVLTAPGEASV